MDVVHILMVIRTTLLINNTFATRSNKVGLWLNAIYDESFSSATLNHNPSHQSVSHCSKLLFSPSNCHTYSSLWTQDINWMYIRCWEAVQDFLWTSYARSIYVLYSGSFVVCITSPFIFIQKIVCPFDLYSSILIRLLCVVQRQHQFVDALNFFFNFCQRNRTLSVKILMSIGSIFRILKS